MFTCPTEHRINSEQPSFALHYHLTFNTCLAWFVEAVELSFFSVDFPPEDFELSADVDLLVD